MHSLTPTVLPVLPQRELPADKMPGHWLLARMGKRVLRPGGIELTRRLLAELAIGEEDDVVEFAPGLGITARLTLASRPHSYTAVERDNAAAAAMQRSPSGPSQRCIVASAEETGLASNSASIVYGEAMLSMQPATTKARIVAEAARLLKPGGRYGIHELCLTPDDVDQTTRDAIQRDLSGDIHVGVRPLTICEWREVLGAAGLTIEAEHQAPMRLLEPDRLVHDEGLLRSLWFAWNLVRHPAARRRIGAMRRTFQNNRDNLAAVAIVARKD